MFYLTLRTSRSSYWTLTAILWKNRLDKVTDWICFFKKRGKIQYSFSVVKSKLLGKWKTEKSKREGHVNLIQKIRQKTLCNMHEILSFSDKFRTVFYFRSLQLDIKELRKPLSVLFLETSAPRPFRKCSVIFFFFFLNGGLGGVWEVEITSSVLEI